MPPKGKGKKGKNNGKPKNQNKQTHRNTTASASTSAAAAARIIPQKLLFEILTRLPAKSLLRFKCVSKQWRTLTSMQNFISAHLSRAPSSVLIQAVYKLPVSRGGEDNQLDPAGDDNQPNPDGEDNQLDPAGDENQPNPDGEDNQLDPDGDENQPDPDGEDDQVKIGGHTIYSYGPPPRASIDAIYDFPGSGVVPFDCHLEVIGSTPNGIVCVSQKPFGENLTLWNPATRLSTSIRAPKLKADPKTHSGVSIGLAYDPSQNDIKIVRILGHTEFLNPHDDVEFYSLKSGAWTVLNLDNVTPFDIRAFRCDAMFEGVPYWRCLIWEPRILDTLCMLVSFLPNRSVLEMEYFGMVMKNRDSPFCMGEIQGCLAAVSWEVLGRSKDEHQVLDVWLKYKTVGWKKLYRIDQSPVIGRVLGIYGERGVVLENERGDRNLYMFHLKDKVLEGSLPTGSFCVRGWYWLLNYKEGLTRIPQPGGSVL